METEKIILPPDKEELKALFHLLCGCCVKEMAAKLRIDEDTAERITKSLRRKTHSNNMQGLLFRLMYYKMIPQAIMDKAIEGYRI